MGTNRSAAARAASQAGALARANDPSPSLADSSIETTYCSLPGCVGVAVAVLTDIGVADSRVGIRVTRPANDRLRLCQHHDEYVMDQLGKVARALVARRQAQRLYDGLEPAQQHSLDGR